MLSKWSWRQFGREVKFCGPNLRAQTSRALLQRGALDIVCCLVREDCLGFTESLSALFLWASAENTISLLAGHQDLCTSVSAFLWSPHSSAGGKATTGLLGAQEHVTGEIPTDPHFHFIPLLGFTKLKVITIEWYILFTFLKMAFWRGNYKRSQHLANWFLPWNCWRLRGSSWPKGRGTLKLSRVNSLLGLQLSWLSGYPDFLKLF